MDFIKKMIMETEYVHIGSYLQLCGIKWETIMDVYGKVTGPAQYGIIGAMNEGYHDKDPITKAESEDEALEILYECALRSGDNNYADRRVKEAKEMVELLRKH